jgi:hypothetical protein
MHIVMRGLHSLVGRPAYSALCNLWAQPRVLLTLVLIISFFYIFRLVLLAYEVCRCTHGRQK